MSQSVQPATFPVIRFRLKWQKIFLALAASLASTILLKYDTIQYLELLYLGLIVLLLLVFVHSGYFARWPRPVFYLGLCYAFFCVAACGLAVASLRFDFYKPLYLAPLKQPVVIAVARTVELIASVAGMLYMVQVFRGDLRKIRFTMRVYFWTGVASGIYSLLSWPLDVLNIVHLGAYSDLHRLRGFYNEGGPYGLYVISVLLVGAALHQLDWDSRRALRLFLVMMAVVFVMSYSKAAMLSLVLLFAINGLFAQSASRRLLVLGAGLVVVFGLMRIVNLPLMLRSYELTAASYERTSHYHAHDPNFVYGRVAGAYLIPKMIARHPLTGIGWGNYGVLRNAPEYRGDAVYVDDADDPGLGIFGVAAELGLPLLAFLLIVLLLPFFYLRHLRSPAYLTNLALLQPVVHLFGAQLNLTYPWVVTAFALGLGWGIAREERLPNPEAPVSLSV